MGPDIPHQHLLEFYLCKAAIPHMKPGAAIVNTSSINAKDPSPKLLAYATTKGAIANFTAGAGADGGEQGHPRERRAPGPIWTPLIPSTMPQEKVKTFGRTRRSAAPASRPSWPRPTCCWHPTRRAISPAR